MNFEQYLRLGLALGIGLLVGVERGWRERDLQEGSRAAGIRTYALSGLLGGVAGILGQALGALAFAAISVPLIVVICAYKLKEQAATKDMSATGVVAAMLVVGLGALATVGDQRLAAAAAVTATGLLATKDILHAWLRRLTWPELRGALILLAMTFVVLPITPNRAIGPAGAINPFEIWGLTIALAGVTFIAYVTTRIFGQGRGLVVASLAGALVSSTAVTLNLARLQKGAGASSSFAGAAMLASAVMAARICAIAAALSVPLLERLAPSLAVFGLVSLATGLALTRHGEPVQGTPHPIKNPLDLSVAIKFALLLATIMAASRILAERYGAQSILPVSALAGLADVDAVTVTVGRAASSGVDLRLCTLAVLVAGTADSLSKCLISAFVGGRRFAMLYAAATALSLALAALTAPWT